MHIHIFHAKQPTAHVDPKAKLAIDISISLAYDREETMRCQKEVGVHRGLCGRGKNWYSGG